MKPFSYLWLLVITRATLKANATPPGSAPVVNLGYAQYQGIVVQDKVTNATHTNFLGMRYAGPPTGPLRFKAPVFPATTHGIQHAKANPPACMQSTNGVTATNPLRDGQLQSRAADPDPSEDCLFLSVYLPGRLGKNKKLPVVVWIHGGGYIEGSASSFDGNNLIRESGEGVVVVIIQYRLGVYGFLPGQKVKDGGTLNAGLLDQQFALKWVQQHIRQFDGNPNMVTIWGESAGGGSVLQQIVANGGQTFPPLFQAAITSSTFLPPQYRYNERIPELLYSETVAQANCSSAADTLACLRAVDIDTLQAANVNINLSGFFGTFVFVPVVDGTVIRDRPTKLLKLGKVNGVKILLSFTNSNEGNIFIDQATANSVQVADYVTQLFPEISENDAQAAAAKYAGLGSNISQVTEIMGESIFVCPTYFLLRAFKGLAFKGEFAILPGNHGQDLSFYFTNGVLPPSTNPDVDTSFAESFMDFAMNLNPNIKHDPTNITPLWKLWEGSNEMLFNQTDALAAAVRPVQTSTELLNRCNFWESVSASTAQ